DLAATRGLENKSKKGLVVAVVNPGQRHGTVDRRSQAVADAAGALERERIARPEHRSPVIVEPRPVQLIGAVLRYHGYLSDGADLRGVVGHIDAKLLEALD